MHRGSTDIDRYSNVAIAFRWVIAALVLFNLIVGVFHDQIGGMSLHKAVGITVLALTAGRVAWRLAHRPPPLPAGTPAWQRLVAHATHSSLYALLLAMPISGWAMASGGRVRRPLNWFGIFDIPYLPVDANTSAVAHDAHGLLGWLMILLVALHVGAALYHQYVKRDRLIARMMPAPR